MFENSLGPPMAFWGEVMEEVKPLCLVLDIVPFPLCIIFLSQLFLM